MNRATLEACWQQAQARGLLPEGARLPPERPSRPWPVLLLTALGAWLAAVPLLFVVALMFGSFFEHGGAYLGGFALLGVAVWALRVPDQPLFVEQLSAPLLLAAGVSLGYALTRDLGGLATPVLLAALAVAVALVIRPSGLQACLGAAAAACTAWAAMGWPVTGWGGPGGWWALMSWTGWQVCVLLWTLTSLLWRWPAERVAGLVSGWGSLTLLGLALSSGAAMLVGAVIGGGWMATAGRELAGEAGSAAVVGWPGGLSAALVLGAAVLLGRAWAPLRQPSLVGVAAVLAALAAVMPNLGAVVWMAAVCCLQARWRLAAAAGAAAVWIVSSFYYQLAWPLMTKATGLAVAGAALAVLALPLMTPRWRGRAAAAGAAGSAAPAVPIRGVRLGALLSGVAVLVVLQVGLAQKEALIATGRTVFVPLAPVDPRSLMQGDYMRLDYGPLVALRGELASSAPGRTPQLVAVLDERQVVQSVRVHTGASLAPGELLLNLTRKQGRWMLVSDAWFFKEGEGSRWARARFGEFRVTPDGQALLVGLRGEALAPL